MAGGGVFHVWFGIKARKPILEGELGPEVTALIGEIARAGGIDVLAVEAAIDHVHLLVRLAAGQTLPWAMQRLKGGSSRFMFLRYPELKLDLGRDAFWQRGYGFRAVPPSRVGAVKRYIATQRDRPVRHW